MPSVFQASWPVGSGKARCCPVRGHSGAPLHLHGNLDDQGDVAHGRRVGSAQAGQ